ncbi:MAG: hypothetical protein FI715_02095 [SAR202 cluster bacterium]|nr:hypothetical protein [SAR202 cluster bacterium]|tara:strand:- start:1255 stop:1533 length:279 start_codon:yes stop_codon:yes gene_type:complete
MLTVSGKSAFMMRLAGQMEDNIKITLSDDIYDGDNATGKFALTGDNFMAIVVDVLNGDYEVVVKDGELASLATVVDAGSLQKLGAALAAVTP